MPLVNSVQNPATTMRSTTATLTTTSRSLSRLPPITVTACTAPSPSRSSVATIRGSLPGTSAST